MSMQTEYWQMAEVLNIDRQPHRAMPAIEADDELQLNLGQIAYDNYHSQVFHAWLNVNEVHRLALATDRYVFLSICNCVHSHLTTLLAVDHQRTVQFVAFLTSLVNALVMKPAAFGEEWFKGLNLLADALATHNFVSEARYCVSVSLKTGVAKFPGIAHTANANAAYLDAMIGRKDKAGKAALRLLKRPYLLPNRRELPKLYYKLMYVLASTNHIAAYRQVIWRGASSIYADRALRDTFIAQIGKTYRGVFRAVIAGDISIAFRLSFVFGAIARAIATIPGASFLKLDGPARGLHLLWLHLLNLSKFSALPNTEESPIIPNSFFRIGVPPIKRTKQRRFLVTRAMGGLGDVMMMTPGLLALKRRYPKTQIEFAVPRSFHPLVQGLPGITIRDINEDQLDMRSYSRWFNLTDCPAGRAEARQYPNVKANRIESFAKAMRISKWRLRFTSGFTPFYAIDDEEIRWAQEQLATLNPQGLPIIALQPFSVDSYKNWPYMEQLALELAEQHFVMVFHHESIQGYNHPNIYKVLEPIRKSVAFLSMATRLVAVDSSFVHIAAAIGVKTVAIFGPTSGKVFSRYYRNVTYVTPNKPDFPCYPCWRNEHKPCHLTNGRESICLRSINSKMVLRSLDNSTPYANKMPITKIIVSWIFYGRQ